ncbi:hypothetical protein CWB73_17790 [Pseudoalteromonas phenolica]|uniref:Uncharacterized protein n=1 Tax=Pseudoalteromonas phenolica TaxID=161398 RepID=A0A5S3YQR7_9GAMM|nr:hypothetical protein CWB73_17790 [Pseudoalteromonas phenolica]
MANYFVASGTEYTHKNKKHTATDCRSSDGCHSSFKSLYSILPFLSFIFSDDALDNKNKCLKLAIRDQ